MINGYLKEIDRFHEGQKVMLYKSAAFLGNVFKRNDMCLKNIRKSVNEQRAELLKEYGLKVSANTMSELKRGIKYKCGFLLLYAIKDYWNKRGIYFSLDE